MDANAKESDTLTQSTAGGDPGLSCPPDRELKTPAADEVSSPAALITEDQVMLGTVAAMTAAPSFEAAEELAPPANSNLMAALSRLFSTSRQRRPARRHYPSRLDFTADARMAREMHRL